ncbi:MAG TPA: hypothetical protein VFF11_03995, partial [Candidatus Binatia bacterium]|nr:hypothetical protein [Candidatus Binatia bacterium]
MVCCSAHAGAFKPSHDAPKPDLAEHMVLQLSSRTNGTSPNFTGPTDGSNRFQRAPTIAPDFWLHDVKNIFAMSQGRFEPMGIMSCANYITPISPHICIGAAHTGGGVGTENLWLLADGSYYTNEIIGSLKPAKAGDIILMFMAKTNWTFVKIFPDATNKLAYWQHPDPTNIVPVFVRFHQGIGRTNRFHSTFVSGSRSLGGLYHVNGQFEYGDYSKGDFWVAGDSAGAAYAIIHNEAVLVGCALSGGFAMPVANYEQQINAAMAELCASNG